VLRFITPSLSRLSGLQLAFVCLAEDETGHRQTARARKHLPASLLDSKRVKKVAHTECRVPELIPVLGSQPTGYVSHKPGGRLPLLSDRPAVTPATLKRAATNFAAW